MVTIDPVSVINKISSQEVLFAVLVLFISAALFVVCLRFFIKLLSRRDEVIKELAGQISTLNICLIKVIEVQNIDHNTAMRNRDLLQEIAQAQSRIDINLSLIIQESRDTRGDLKEHARECLKKV